MHNKALLIILIAILCSGCSEPASTVSGSGEGLFLKEFTVGSSQLEPKERTEVRAVFVNQKKEETTLKEEDIELFNTGEMEVLEKDCLPNEIKKAREGHSPTMECVWEVKAPGEDWIKGFPTKPLSVNLVFSYTSKITPDDPLSIAFKEEENVEGRADVKQQLSDGKIEVSIKGRSPYPKNEDQKLEIKATNIGPGRVEGDGYEFEYSPESVFESDEEECPREPEMINQEAKFDCKIKTDLTGERKLFITTSYKYEQIHNNVIEVSD